MAPHDEEDDPAIYRSGTSKQPLPSPPSTSTSNRSFSTTSTTTTTASSSGFPMDHENPLFRLPFHHLPFNPDTEMRDSSADDDDDDSDTLLTVQPSFNRLLLVLRDERVMKFVKYVSASAEGSRWDVCGEYEVGMVQTEDESGKK